MSSLPLSNGHGSTCFPNPRLSWSTSGHRDLLRVVQVGVEKERTLDGLWNVSMTSALAMQMTTGSECLHTLRVAPLWCYRPRPYDRLRLAIADGTKQLCCYLIWLAFRRVRVNRMGVDLLRKVRVRLALSAAVTSTTHKKAGKENTIRLGVTSGHVAVRFSFRFLFRARDSVPIYHGLRHGRFCYVGALVKNSKSPFQVDGKSTLLSKIHVHVLVNTKSGPHGSYQDGVDAETRQAHFESPSTTNETVNNW